MILLPAISPNIKRSGRWQTLQNDASSLFASWCGASLSFIYTGLSLSVKIGPLTERKDRFNGGTPMLACIISEGSESESIETKLYQDFEPSQIVKLVSANSDEEIGRKKMLELILVDWASVLEIEGFYTDSENEILKPSKAEEIHVLHIGDSISCGFSNGSQPIPRGCLEAFPFIARDVLRKKDMHMEIDLVAFPGISLTDPTPEELEEDVNMATGMATRFLHASPWSKSEWKGERMSADILVVALGTNDDARDIDAASYQDALCSLVSKVYQFNTRTLKHFFILHPFPDFSETCDDGLIGNSALITHFPSFLEILRSRFPFLAVDMCDIGNGISETHTMDKLHPTAEGHAILGNLWSNELQRLWKPSELGLPST